MIANNLPISAQLLAENQAVFREYNHLIIQHLKSDTAEIAIALSDIGCNLLHLVAIDYSVDPAALSSVRERGIQVSVESFERISDFVSNFISYCTAGDVVVWDVGGYAADVVSDPNLAKKIRFVLEDTNGGLWRYHSSALQCPVIEVASIENKKIENAFVGRRIVEASEDFFKSISLNMLQQEIVVIGFGGIGQSVCVALRLEGVNATVVEIDQRKLALAHALGHAIATSVGSLPNAKVILGCTGAASVKLDDLRRLANRAYLISGSSRKIEFSDVLNRGQISKGRNGQLIEESTNCVTVNNGEPINLRAASLSAEISDFMYANVIGAVVEGGDLQGSGVFQLSDAWQRKVCHLWVRRYLEVGCMTANTATAGGQSEL